MNDPKRSKIIWTERALQNSASIKRYISDQFGQREIDNFYELLRSFEEGVSIFPYSHPPAKKQSTIRRAVLSKVLSAFYKINLHGFPRVGELGRVHRTEEFLFSRLVDDRAHDRGIHPCEGRKRIPAPVHRVVHEALAMRSFNSMTIARGVFFGATIAFQVTNS